MSKIAFIVGTFYPNYSANGICVKKICDEFIKQGHDVYCFSRKIYGTSDFYNIDGIKNYRFESEHYKIIDDCIKNNKKLNFFLKIILKIYLFIFKKINIVINLLIYPNVINTRKNKIFSKFYMINKNVNFDLVICVFSPLENVHIGKIIKEKLSIPTVLYNLDCLNGGYKPRFLSNKAASKKIRRLENKLYSYYDYIVLLRSHSNIYTESSYSNLYDKFIFLDIPLYHKLSKKSNFKFENGINLVYVGSLLKKMREPFKVLSLLNNINLSNMVVHFYGNFNNVKINKDEYKNIEIKINRHVSHDFIENIILTSDYLINIGNYNSNLIPSKVFEYISSGKPIINFHYLSNDPTLIYLEKYPYSININVNKNFETNIELLTKFMTKDFTNSNSNSDYDQYFKENMPSYFVSVIMDKFGN